MANIRARISRRAPGSSRRSQSRESYWSPTWACTPIPRRTATYVSLTLSRVHFGTSQTVSAPCISVSAVTVEGQLCLTVQYATPIWPEAEAEAYTSMAWCALSRYRKGRGGLAGLSQVARLCPRLCPTPQAQRCGPRRATTRTRKTQIHHSKRIPFLIPSRS